MFRKVLLCILLGVLGCRGQQPTGMLSQYPSPMEEFIRPHDRVGGDEFNGNRMLLSGIFHRDPVLLLPTQEEIEPLDSVNLLIHFHGAEGVVGHALQQNHGWVGVAVNLGNGSKAYGSPLERKESFDRLVAAVRQELSKPIRRIYLSGFSAGYGAVRAILRTENYLLIDGVLLLDGLHAGYLPVRTPIYQGGKIDEGDLEAFVRLASDAVIGERQFVLTHSSVFPGTFASTTECVDFLLREVGASRSPWLNTGPLGMQQVGQSSKGKLQVLAFAGNTAPDHIDHLHGLFYFIGLLD
ncbi:hypothetical protein [Lunatimonas salinarum]|uniref:hypothetical protein n=1 Tax=Lunatimonas salinarum TaxID=1774590 RepID=UPI001FD7CB51|nr:hypothetical protein [Lunatimonas salinarum]